MVTKLRLVETRDEAILRLAGLAKKRGIRVLTYPLTGEQFALSLSHPETVHRVTRLGCDCLGFTYHNRCTHYAALLESLGELPPEQPGSPAAPAQVAAPVVLCDACDEVMAHVNGVAFECACGGLYEIDWETADEVDVALAELSRQDPDRYDAVTRMLSDELTAGDTSREGRRSDAPAALGLYGVSPNEIAAVLIWRADLDSRSDDAIAA
ncbi:MAG TPA: hypothetical protein VHR64_12905 [Thermomicrobiales bacterium]|jgi:hypothetical protein|nr:hypothetical protein [Thermomicrobiales bacterium]